MVGNLFRKKQFTGFEGSTAVASTRYAPLEKVLTPIQNHLFCTKYFEKYSSENIIEISHYSSSISNYTDEEKLEIIQEFASKLLENSENLDPLIVEALNEGFWDLI